MIDLSHEPEVLISLPWLEWLVLCNARKSTEDLGDVTRGRVQQRFGAFLGRAFFRRGQ